MNKAEASIQRGDYAAAQAHLDAAKLWLEGATAKKDTAAALTARYHWLQALVYYYRGDNTAARTELQPALKLLEGKKTDKRLLAEVLNSLGNIEYLDNAMDAAASYYKRCAELAEQFSEHGLAAKAWLNMGIVRMNRGQHSEALFVYNKAARFAEADNDIAMKVLCYRRMCYIYVQIGPLSRAVEYAERIIELLSSVSNQNQVCQALIAVAVVYDYNGEFDRSIQYLNRALEMGAMSDNKLASTNALMKMSQTYWDMGNIDASFEVASKLFADPITPPLARKELAALLTEYYVKAGDLAQAHHYLNWIKETDANCEQAEQSLPYLTFAYLYAAQNDWSRAAQYFERAIEQSKKRRDMYELGFRYFEYGKAILKHEGAIANALLMLKEAAAIFQRIRANHLLAQVNETFANIESSFDLSGLTPTSPAHQQGEQFRRFLLGIMHAQHMVTQIRQQGIHFG